MCVLCGEFVARLHWTDRHIEDEARAPGSETGDYHRNRQRDRYYRANLANQVLWYYGLKVEDWSSSKYLLRDLTGRTELVQDLGSMWPAAAKLAGQPLDPLDPALQNAMNSVT